MTQRRLTWEEAQDVRRRWEVDHHEYQDLALAYSVDYMTIWRIVNGYSYTEPGRSVTEYQAYQGREGCVAQNGVYHGNGKAIDDWLKHARGCDQRAINQITARRFRYGSFRPSDRAALLVDAAPTLTPFADDLALAAD